MKVQLFLLAMLIVCSFSATCLFNQFADPGATTAGACVACTAVGGTTAPITTAALAMAFCNTCTIATTGGNTAVKTCTACMPGYFLVSPGTAAASCGTAVCTAGCRVCASASTCTTCQNGYFLTSTNTCSVCDNGPTSSGRAGCACCTTSAANCVSCTGWSNLSILSLLAILSIIALLF